MNFDGILRPVFYEGLQQINHWYVQAESSYLESIFNQVGFWQPTSDSFPYYVPPDRLSEHLNYPAKDTFAFGQLKLKIASEIKETHKNFAPEYLSELNINQLYFLLQKYGGNIPGTNRKISLFDSCKIKAARAIIKSNQTQHASSDNLLIHIDLSGIQKFIYNIISLNALKNLRARSFFIELLALHAIDRILKAFHLHEVNVLMNGGGSILILANSLPDYSGIVSTIERGLNQWLLDEFNGKLHVAFAAVTCSDADLETNLSQVLDRVTEAAFEKKHTKFLALIREDKFRFVSETDPAFNYCDICHKDDDREKLIRLPRFEDRYRCKFCQKITHIGGKIPGIRYIYVCPGDVGENCLKIDDSYYLISETRQDTEAKWIIFEDRPDLLHEIAADSVLVFFKAYSLKVQDLPEDVKRRIGRERDELWNKKKKAEDEKAAPAIIEQLQDEINARNPLNMAMLEHLAEAADGVKYIAALRMDADNFGKILQHGFQTQHSLENVTAFSRNVHYFFKIYLNFLCQHPQLVPENTTQNPMAKNRRYAQVIYAGGDDLFILGAWNDVFELALDIGKAFHDFTSNNYDLGISGGVTLHRANFPVSRMAQSSAEALTAAKSDLDLCWMCHPDWMQCPLYRNGLCLRKDALAPFYTEYNAHRKRVIDEKFPAPKYQPGVSRLSLTLKWKRFTKKVDKEPRSMNEVEEYLIHPLDKFRDYSTLRLPRQFFYKIHSLLELWYEEGLLYLPRVAWVLKQSIKLRRKDSGYTEKKELADKYDFYLHLGDKKMLSTLHIPVSWIIYLIRGGNRNE
jgi:CRISPR-associated protein Csm1